MANKIEKHNKPRNQGWGSWGVIPPKEGYKTVTPKETVDIMTDEAQVRTLEELQLQYGVGEPWELKVRAMASDAIRDPHTYVDGYQIPIVRLTATNSYQMVTVRLHPALHNYKAEALLIAEEQIRQQTVGYFVAIGAAAKTAQKSHEGAGAFIKALNDEMKKHTHELEFAWGDLLDDEQPPPETRDDVFEALLADWEVASYQAYDDDDAVVAERAAWEARWRQAQS